MVKILSLDPGGTTGYSWCELDPGDKKQIPEFYGGQIGPGKHHLDLFNLLQEGWDVVVCESFEYRMVAIDDDKTGTVYSPVIELISKEYIGVVELWSQGTQTGRAAKIVFQKPAVAVGQKTFWTKEKMVKMGVYKSGERHRNDATRHLLHYTVTKLGYRAILSYLRRPPSSTV